MIMRIRPRTPAPQKGQFSGAADTTHILTRIDSPKRLRLDPYTDGRAGRLRFSRAGSR